MTNFKRTGGRLMALGLAAVTASFLVVSAADARMGNNRNFGDRGSRSESAPPSTATAPRPAQALPGQAQPGFNRAAPAAGAAQAARPGFGGLMGGLAAGLLGAGLFGLLAGSGFFSGLGSLAGILGFMLQLALIAGVVFLVMRFFRNRQAASANGAPVGNDYGRTAQPEPQPRQWQPAPPAPASLSGLGGGLAGGAAVPAQPVETAPLDITPEDFNAFEQRLTEIQISYARDDRTRVAQLSDPVVANELLGEMADLSRQGRGCRDPQPKLLQGDLAEAWSEPAGEFATVAMRYAMIDAVYDKATGRVVEGNADRPVEATEIWTFRRDKGEGHEGWRLTAIQQA